MKLNKNQPKENIMHTLTNRTNEKFIFLTIIFETREGAEKNADESRGEFVSSADVLTHGHRGFIIKASDGYKEFAKLAI